MVWDHCSLLGEKGKALNPSDMAKASPEMTWSTWEGQRQEKLCTAQLKEQIKFLHEKWRRVWAITEFSPSLWSVISTCSHLSSSFSLVSQGSIFHPISTAVPHSSGPPDVYLIKLIGCHLTKSHEARFSKLVLLGIKHLLCVRFLIPLVLFLLIKQVLIFFCHLAHLKVKKTETK